MARVACPKCGAAVTAQAVICPACDFIVDTSFLEDFTTEVHVAPVRPGAAPAERPEARPKDGAFADVDAEADDFDDGLGAKTVPGMRVNTKTAPHDDDQIDTAPHRAFASSALTAPSSPSSRPYGGEALILGDLSSDFDSMLSDQTSSYAVGRDLARIFEPAPVYVAQSLKAMIEPGAVLGLKGASPDALQLSSFERSVVALIDGQRPVARIARKGGISMDDLKIAIGMLADRHLLVLKGRVKKKGAPLSGDVGGDGGPARGAVGAAVDDADENISIDDSGDIFIIESEDAVADDELRVQHALDPFNAEPGGETAPIMDMPLGVGPLDAPPITEPDARSPGPVSMAPETPSAIFARARPITVALPAPLLEKKLPLPAPIEAPAPAPIEAPAPAPVDRPAPVTVVTRVPEALRTPGSAPAPVDVTAPLPLDLDPILPPDPDADVDFVEDAMADADEEADVDGAASFDPEVPVAVGTIIGEGGAELGRDEPPPEAETAFDGEVVVRPAAALRPAMPTRAARATVVSAPVSSATASVPSVAPGAMGSSDILKAEQMLELALADLREGRTSRALAYAKMAAKHDTQNERVQELLAGWNNPAKLASMTATPDQRLVSDAQRAEDAREYDKSVDLYKKAIALKPEEPELRNRLGVLYALRLKDYTAATSELMRACEMAPDNLAYRSNLGKIFKLANGSPSDATMHTGTDDEKLRAAGKKPTLFDRLRGKK